MTPSPLAALAAWKGSPKDVARWAFWVPFRDLLDPTKPDQLRRLYPLWRAQHGLAGAQRRLMEAELRACFPEVQDTQALVEEAYRVAFRVHLEELLLGKLDATTWPLYMRYDRQDHLEQALARGKGAIIAIPHAGNVMMLIAALSLGGYRYTQYAARGLAPDDVAAANPATFGHNRWRTRVRSTREANEDRLPASYLDLRHSVRELYRRLGNNELVGIAYDGRIGQRFAPTPYLGRTALLNPGAFKLAASTGAAIVGGLCACPADGPNVLQFGAPIWGDDAVDLQARFYGQVAEPFLRQHPGHYGIWLAHCRERSAVDDHPLFVDYAPDERWKKWAPQP